MLTPEQLEHYKQFRGTPIETLLQHIEEQAARYEKLLDGLVEHQKHRDAWRGYAYGNREKPMDFLDGNMADRPQTKIEEQAGRIRALEADGERLKWLEENEHCLSTYREKSEDWYTVWWVVTTPNGTQLTHPYGNPYAAIDAARSEVPRGE